MVIEGGRQTEMRKTKLRRVENTPFIWEMRNAWVYARLWQRV